jgi:ADP-ribose pyrophosphatase
VHGLHPEAELAFAGVRINVKTLALPVRGGGEPHRREVVEAADAVVILPLITPEEAAAAGFELPPPAGLFAEAASGLADMQGQLPGAGGVVLIRNERFAVGETLWELPAGTVETGESPDDCAPRELAEETGFACDKIEKLTDFFPTPGFCTERLHAYRARGLSYVGQDLDATEKITAEVVPWEQALAMVRGGDIRDAKTIATLLFHESFKDEG